MVEVGTELFRAVFQASEDARDLWAEMRKRLPETRIEIATGVAEAATIPWELLRDPKTDAPLALTARSFVRAQPTAALTPNLPAKKKGKIRILSEQADKPYEAAVARLNVAIALFQTDRRTDALEYAEAAMRGFESYGAGAAEKIEQTRRLIAEIRER